MRCLVWPPLVSLMLAALLSPACTCGGDPPDAGPDAGPAPLPLQIGPLEPVIEGTIGPEGGSLVVQEGALAGVRLDVPAGAYDAPVHFALSQAPIEDNTVEGLVTLSPYLEVVTDAPVAREALTFTIPAVVEQGFAAMGFFYDPATGDFDGIPTYPSADGAARVLVLRHFTGVVLAAAEMAVISAIPLPTGFERGTDDFAFENTGTFTAPEGTCGGWSVAALHAFLTRRTPTTHLMDLVDNDRRPGFATPAFGLDDTGAIQLVTAIQQEVSFAGEEAQFYEKLQQENNPTLAFELLTFSLWLTGKPQFLGVFRPVQVDGRTSMVGHALIVTSKDALGDQTNVEAQVATPINFNISDPNHPWSKDPSYRAVTFDVDRADFVDYSGAERAGGPGHVYPFHAYYGTYALNDFDQVERLWQRFEAHDLGAYLPAVQLMVATTGEPGSPISPLIDGLNRTSPDLFVLPEETIEFLPRITVFSDTLQELARSTLVDPFVQVTLDEGDNLLGFLVEGLVESAAGFRYVDFRWVVVRYEPATPGRPIVLGRTDLPAPASAVDVDGTTAWVGLSTPGLASVDISAEASPRMIVSQDLPSFAAAAGVRVLPDHHLAIGAGTFLLVDAADPAAPTVTSETLVGGFCGPLEVLGTLAAVACGRTNTSRGLVGLVSVEDPTNPDLPRALGGISFGANAVDAAPLGPTRVLSLDSRGDVLVFDSTDPTAPGQTPLATVDSTITGGEALDLEGGRAYVLGPGLRIIDLTTPESPTTLGGSEFTTGFDLAVSGTTLVTVDAGLDGGIVNLYDVSDPTDPTYVDQVLLPQETPTAVHAVGNRAYVATARTNGTQGGLVIIGW